LVERSTENREVQGSTPCPATSVRRFAPSPNDRAFLFLEAPVQPLRYRRLRRDKKAAAQPLQIGGFAAIEACGIAAPALIG
jgi:hypothetical protein